MIGTFSTRYRLVQAEDRDADGIGIAANGLTLNGGAIRLAAEDAVEAVMSLRREPWPIPARCPVTGGRTCYRATPAVAAGLDRKVDGSRVAARR